MIAQKVTVQGMLFFVIVLQNNLVISQQEQSPSPKAVANELAIRLEKGQNDPEACIAVIQALNSDNQETRYAIFERIAIHSKGRRVSKGYQPPPVLSLQQFGELSEQLVLSVIPFLQDRSPTRRLVATKVLYDWQVGANAAASALEKAIKDPNPNVGSSALLAFASCSADEQLVTRVLLENIEHSNDLIKYEAMRGLRDFGPTTCDTVPILAAALGSKNHDVRSTALFAIWKLKKHAKMAIPELRSLISKGSDPRYHLAAASALLYFVPDDLEAIDILVDALPAILQDNELMSGVHGYLGFEVCKQLGPRAAIAAPRLKEPYGGADAMPDLLARNLLLGMGATTVHWRPYELLHSEELLGSEDPDIRRIAAEALIRHDPNSEAAGKGVDILPRALKDAAADGRLIVSILKHARARQDEIVAALFSELGNPDATVRREACISLSGFPEKSSVISPALLEKLKDASDSVRCCAAYSLLNLQPGKADALAELNRIAFSESAKVRGLLLQIPMLDPKYQMPIVMHLLRDTDPEIRRRAMQTYCIWEPAKAAVTPLLIAELKEESDDRRLQAARDLKLCHPEAPELVPALLEIFKKDNPSSSREVLMILGSLGRHAQAAIPTLTLAMDTRRTFEKELCAALRNIQFPDE